MTELRSFIERPKLRLTRVEFPHARARHFEVYDAETGTTGFGGADDEKLAQTKALFEWLERRVYRAHGAQSSSGWAAHTSLALARRNAALELIERDALLCSWLGKIAPRILPAIEFYYFNQKFPLLQFGAGPNFFVVGVVLTREDNGKKMLISTTAETIEEARVKLLIDSERAYALLGPSEPISDCALRSHHESFCALPSANLEWLLAGGEGLSYGAPSVTYREFSLPLWNGEMAYVVEAESKQLQPLYFGRPTLRTVNRSRLRALGARRLNRELHPIL